MLYSRNAHKPRIYDPIQYTFKGPMYSNGALAPVFTERYLIHRDWYEWITVFSVSQSRKELILPCRRRIGTGRL